MGPRLRWFGIALSIFLAPAAFAGLDDIRQHKLPQNEKVGKAYADVLTVESFVRAWNPTWPYKVPKSQVVSLLKASLADLQKAVSSSADNQELLLLTGLVAHYAYNVDVNDADEVAVNSLEKARQLAPQDYRAEWFLGTHKCQANHIEEGMQMLLTIERARSAEQLPSGFWDDYIDCALVADMPAHAIRAGDHLRRSQAEPSIERDQLIEIARKRSTVPSLTATYSSRDVWSSQTVGSTVEFKNFMFGFDFSIPAEWRLNLPDVQKGFCMVQIDAGSHAGKTGPVTPNILIIARQPRPGETLDGFLKAAIAGVSGKSTSAVACPARDCLAFDGVRRGLYKTEGDGHALLTAFERAEPEFPGLVLEEPTVPRPPNAGRTTYFVAPQRLRRVEGTLYYLVLLDTADSVLKEATVDYETFLRNMRAE